MKCSTCGNTGSVIIGVEHDGQGQYQPLTDECPDCDPALVIQGLPLYRCPACGKQHIQWSGTVCPCGEPFERWARFESRTAVGTLR